MEGIRQFAIVQTVVEAHFDNDGKRCEADRAVVVVPARALAAVFQISTAHGDGSVYLVFEDHDGVFLYRGGEYVRPTLRGA